MNQNRESIKASLQRVIATVESWSKEIDGFDEAEILIWERMLKGALASFDLGGKLHDSYQIVKEAGCGEKFTEYLRNPPEKALHATSRKN